MKINSGKNGFITLLLVLITSAIGVAIATSVIISGLGSSRNGLTLIQSDQARALTDACAERGLEAIRDDPNASGTTNMNIGQGNCSYTISGSGDNRTVVAIGQLSEAKRKVNVIINAIKPKINVTSWQEVR